MSSHQEKLDRASSGMLAQDLSKDQQIVEVDSEKPAGYKIEITYGPDRTPNGPNISCLQLWESGTRFDGGGDDKMFWCQDVRPGENSGCWGAIPPGALVGGVARCPSCKSMINVNFLTGEKFVKLTTEALALEVETLFRSLKNNADVYCKYHPTDMRYIALRNSHGLEKARRLRGLFIYPLKNIIKDTANGASLFSRFRAYLSA